MNEQNKILDTLKDIQSAIELKDGVEEVSVRNIEAAKADLSEVVSVLRALLEKETAPIVVNPAKNDVTLDLAPILVVLERVEKKIQTYTQPEIADYTELLSEIATLLSKPEEQVDLSKIESGIASLAKTEDISALAEWLEAIYKKANPDQPPFLFDKYGRLLVAVDKTVGGGGGGGGLTQIETNKLLTLATEEKQDAEVAKMEEVRVGISSLENTTGNLVDTLATQTNQEDTTTAVKRGLYIPTFDYCAQVQASTTDTWTFKTGGAGGTTVATVVITYTDSTKAVISNVAQS